MMKVVESKVVKARAGQSQRRRREDEGALNKLKFEEWVVGKEVDVRMAPRRWWVAAWEE